MNIPVGFNERNQFVPSAEQLLQNYLTPKISGDQLPCDVIEEVEMYGPNANPWVVLDDFSGDHLNKTAYVFVRLTKKGPSHYNRKAGCGIWSAKTRGINIMDKTGEIIGTKRLLGFHIRDVTGLDLTQVGSWKMYEYSLFGRHDYVVCQVIQDTSKMARVFRS